MTDLGAGVHDAVFAVGPIDAPLVRLRVVEAQSQSLDVSAGTIEFDLLADGASIPDFARDEGAIELDPRCSIQGGNGRAVLSGPSRYLEQSRSRADHPAPT